ncbi:MAG: acyl-[acyl-carrier-protein] thioesterase [Lachnospiraceae bacterium]|nr:acyl-[acyl-carrier-protein] thioesterase [Lachnospiraceae bacterium]
MYSFKSRVRYSEVEENGNLTVSAIMRYMADCAMFDSIAIDYDLDRLNEQNMGWYITEWQVRINKRPVLGQDIVINTWAYKFRGMMGFRNFDIETEDGEKLVEADSMWIFMDLKQLKPINVPDDMSAGFVSETPINRKWLPRKIPKSYEIEAKQDIKDIDFTFKVRQMHIDTNHHMNNSRYIEAVTECLDDDSKVSYIRASYKQVAYKGDIINVSAADIDNGVQAVLYNDDTEFAVVEFYFDLDKIEGIE